MAKGATLYTLTKGQTMQELKKVLDDAEIIFVNHSGGKDSQAMTIKLLEMGYANKMHLVHADLGEMEWEEMKPWIEKTCPTLPLTVVGEDNNFFELSDRFNRLPGGVARFCTNELKTVPCERFMREYCKQNNITNAVSALGIRADESQRRAKQTPIKQKTKLLTVVFPIFEDSEAQVFARIAAAGQTPHRIYSEGFSRLSCAVCVYGRIDEHKLAATKKPELMRKMMLQEIKLNKSLRIKQRHGVKLKKFLIEYIELSKEQKELLNKELQDANLLSLLPAS